MESTQVSNQTALKTKSAPVFKEYQSASPSLKDFHINKPENIVNPTEDLNQDKVVTGSEGEIDLKKLEISWKNFATTIEKQMPRMYQVLLSHLPVIDELNTISVLMDNTSQQKDFMEKIHSKLCSFIKKELSINQFEIKVVVSEDAPIQNMVYTNNDKFNYLAEKNELLFTLKKALNLDFE